MAKSKEEKISKIDEMIKIENDAILKSKEKIKKLSADKKKLQKQIQHEKFSELENTLKDYGIHSVSDFEKFVNEYSNSTSEYENSENSKINQ